jgi:hypothetical protein
MNHAGLKRKLIDAARAHPPSDRVPFAFEKRIIARVQDVRPLDFWGLWGHALLRAAAPCVAITLLLGAWNWFSPATTQADLSQDFENTLLAVADQDSSVDLSR